MEKPFMMQTQNDLYLHAATLIEAESFCQMFIIYLFGLLLSAEAIYKKYGEWKTLHLVYIFT